ncbi:MAG: glycine zipper 2TM domain-containing protein [Magnetococcales bacterium]|nr:glycine zipper 2TM domain-containing protein [Magnetococcales bacterium]
MKKYTVALVAAVFLALSTGERAEAMGTEFGALAGATVGSLMGPHDQVEHALIGAVIGGVIGSAIDAEAREGSDTVVYTTETYPTRHIVAEPVHYRGGHRWHPHRHRHWEHHRHHDRGHYRDHRRWDRHDRWRNWD